jgi:large subunit ribosomal protein L18
MDKKLERRQKIKFRIRKKIAGTSVKPRLSVYRSNTDIYLQLIDDVTGATLAASSTKSKDIAAQKTTKTEQSKLAGAAIGRKAVELGITQCVFDRGGHIYHGRIKAAAEGAREGGLVF